jgi:hypothetical protein
VVLGAQKDLVVQVDLVDLVVQLYRVNLDNQEIPEVLEDLEVLVGLVVQGGLVDQMGQVFQKDLEIREVSLLKNNFCILMH